MLKKYNPVDSLAWTDSSSEKLKLDWNEGDLLVPEIREKVLNFLESNNSTYYPVLDNSQLLFELSKYCALSEFNIELTASSDYAHEIVLKFLLNRKRDSKVVIFTPTYDNFRSTAETYFASIDLVELGSENYLSCLQYDFSSIDLVYLSNPNNPTTDFLDHDRLKEVLSSYPETLFLIDEAYIDFDISRSVKDLVMVYSNIVISRTFSKAFGLAAFRVGYLLANEIIISDLQNFNNVKYVNAFAKIAAMECLLHVDRIQNYIDLVNLNKIRLEQACKSSSLIKKVKSGGGNFLLIECHDSKKLWSTLRNQSIYVRSLAHLNGLDDWLRITVPSKGLERILEIL
jgi:histidinol-phosphate aminotransferase